MDHHHHKYVTTSIVYSVEHSRTDHLFSFVYKGNELTRDVLRKWNEFRSKFRFYTVSLSVRRNNCKKMVFKKHVKGICEVEKGERKEFWLENRLINLLKGD